MLSGKKYSYIPDKSCHWETRTASKGKDGKPDHDAAMTGMIDVRGGAARANIPNTV